MEEAVQEEDLQGKLLQVQPGPVRVAPAHATGATCGVRQHLQGQDRQGMEEAVQEGKLQRLLLVRRALRLAAALAAGGVLGQLQGGHPQAAEEKLQEDHVQGMLRMRRALQPPPACGLAATLTTAEVPRKLQVCLDQAAEDQL
jgi:hypothetical protein